MECHHHHHHHHIVEGLGMFPVPWASRWSWSLPLFLGCPMFLRPFGLYCSACLVVCLCPSFVHVVATFPGTVLFPLLCPVLHFFCLIHWCFSLLFYINILIQFFLSSTRFRHLMFNIRKTILYIQPADSLHKCMNKYYIGLYVQYMKTLLCIQPADCLHKCAKNMPCKAVCTT